MLKCFQRSFHKCLAPITSHNASRSLSQASSLQAGAKKGSGQACSGSASLCWAGGLPCISDGLISKLGLMPCHRSGRRGLIMASCGRPSRLSLITAAAALATTLLVSLVKPTMGQAYTIPGLSDLPALPGLASGLINSVTTGASCGHSRHRLFGAMLAVPGPGLFFVNDITMNMAFGASGPTSASPTTVRKPIGLLAISQQGTFCWVRQQERKQTDAV